MAESDEYWASTAPSRASVTQIHVWKKASFLHNKCIAGWDSDATRGVVGSSSRVTKDDVKAALGYAKALTVGERVTPTPGPSRGGPTAHPTA